MTDQRPEQTLVQWGMRLQEAHSLLRAAMEELIDNKDYSAVESLLRSTDRAIVDLIKDAGGAVP